MKIAVLAIGGALLAVFLIGALITMAALNELGKEVGNDG